MPPELLQRLALALAEDGPRGGGRGAPRGPLLPARGVGHERAAGVRRDPAAEGARRWRAAGRGAEALAIVDGLDREVPGFAFTKDGLEAFVTTPRVQYVAGEIAALAGDTPRRARTGRQAAAGKEGILPRPALRLPRRAAARRRGRGGVARRGWKQALAESDAFLEAGTSFPGVVAAAQGVLLRALGREDEARARLRKALLLPDQRLSHFLARRALAETCR